MNFDINTIFLSCGILGTVVFLVKIFLPIDSSPEITSDFTSMSDVDTSFNILTVESVSAFCMTAGWMGYFALRLNYGTNISLTIASISGLFAMIFFAWCISKFKNMDDSSKLNLNDLVGKVGKSYMKFPPNGLSKIEIEFNSRLEILDAKNNSDIEIDSFQPIKVVKIENNTIYIEKE